MANLSANSRCRCCGHLTLDEADAWEICPICFWEDDPVAVKAADGRTGANGVSLVEAQANYVSFGVSEHRFKDRVRAPSPEEAEASVSARVSRPIYLWTRTSPC